MSQLGSSQKMPHQLYCRCDCAWRDKDLPGLGWPSDHAPLLVSHTVIHMDGQTGNSIDDIEMG